MDQLTGADRVAAEAGGRTHGGLARALSLIAAFALAGVGAFFYFNRGGSSSELSGSVQMVGSESMRPTVSACAEDFMTRNPRADIVVRGGGSGDGIAALLHGMTDIAMASRELSQRERDYAASRAIELVVFALALDGVAIIVNRANPVDVLTVEQVRDVFVARKRNWVDLGAGEAEILAFARAPGSGTAAIFHDRVLAEEDYAGAVARLPTNEAIVAEVAARPGAIGYTDLGALRRGGERVKAVALRADRLTAPVVATTEAVSSGNYPLSRRLTLVTAGRPLGTAQAFIDFCLSAPGRSLLQRAGYIVAARQ
jgi:phosphate transport system substrate-binding protein